MILTPRILLRIAALILVAAVLQVSFFGQLTLFGVPPDVLPVLAVALGLLGGAVIGAVAGFATGLLIDSMLLQTLGVSSLALLAAGYLAGRWRETFDITSSLVPPLLAGALTTVAAAAFAVIQLMLGVDAPISLLVLREIVLQGLFAAALAVPIYPGVRRLLRPALVDGAPRRRRRSARAPTRAPSLGPRRAVHR